MERFSSITSENIVLGALLNNINLILSFPIMKSDYFSVMLNKYLFNVLHEMFKSGATTVDIMDVYAMFERDKTKKDELDDNGGLEHLENLRIISEDKTEAEVIIHARNLISCQYKNELIATLNGVRNYVESNPTKTMEELNDIAEAEVLNLKSKYNSGDRIEKISDRLDEIRQNIEDRRNGNISGFPTFSPTLNRFCTYENGEMVVISAKAKAGKSQWVVNEVYNLAIKAGVPILVLDTELQTEAFMVRLVARITGYKFNYIKKGYYKDSVVATEKVEEAYKQVSEATFFHQYIVGWSHQKILTEIKRLKIQYGLEIVIYDYLKIEEAGMNGVAEHQALGNLTNFLKNDVAGALKVAVVTLAQQSDYSDRGLRIADSEKIKKYASTIIFMVRKNKEQYARDLNELGGTHYLFVSYNRNGPQMDEDKQDMGINITFDRSKAEFKDADYQREEIIRLAEENEEI